MATFGKTTDGAGASGSSANRKKVSSASPSTSGVATSITIRGRVTVESTVIKGVIYGDNAGAPGALLAVSDEIVVNSTVEQNWTGALVEPISVVAGVTYWVGWLQQDPGTGDFEISRNDSGSSNLSQTNTDTYADGPTDPFGAASPEAGPVDVFVTYTETETRRFYLANDVSPVQPGWLTTGTDDNSGIVTLLRLSGTPFGAATSHVASETDPDAPYWLSQRAWLSAPASAPGTVAGGWESVIGWFESSTAADFYRWLLVGVLAGNTATNRGSPLNLVIGDDEMHASGGASRVSGTTAAVDFLAGDRLVFHLGWRADNASATSYSSTIHYGGTGGTALAEGGTDFTRPAWVDLPITPGVTFAEPAAGPSVARRSGGFLGLLG